MRQTPAVAAFSILGLAACGAEKAHPPLAGDCTMNCGAPPPSGSTAGGSTSSGTAGTATTGAASDAGVDLSVAVQTTIDERFADTQAYSGNVRVGAVGVDGSETSMSGGANAIVIAGVRAGLNWFAIQDDPAPLGVLLPTLDMVLVDAASPQVSLVAVPAMTFTNALLTSDLPLPDPTAAQAIVTFEENLVPVAGVKIVGDVADGGLATISVAYDGGGAYLPASAVATSATGPLGTALLLNWQAAAYYPGSTTTIAYVPPGGTTRGVDIKLARGFVTRARIALQ